MSDQKQNPSSSLVKYVPYTDEAADEEAARMKRRSPFLKLNVGETVIRIPPPPIGRVTPKGLPTPYIEASQHRIDVPGAQYQFKFPCPRVHYGKPCPVCREAGRLKASPHKLDQDKAYALMPKTRYYVEVIDRDEESAGWKVWEFGPRMMQDLNTLRRSKRGGGDFTDPNKGFDLIVARQGTGQTDTRYNLTPMRESTPFGNMTLLEPDNRPDMGYFVREMAEEDIERGVQGSGDEDEPEVAPAPAPQRQQQAQPSRRVMETTAQPAPQRQQAQPAASRQPSRRADEIIENDGDALDDPDELKF